MKMKHLALALALACSCALATPAAPAVAADESPSAIIEAAQAAEEAREDMHEVFPRTTLRAGQFVWKRGREDSAVTRVVVDVTGQMAYAYHDDDLIAASTISSGTARNPSPHGIFEILEKKRMHRSVRYDNAPMPYMQRIDDYGIALHAGHLPGRPASHGCVRLPAEFAARLFSATEVGTPVMMGKPSILAELRSKGYRV
jgi:hypothetical protein